MAGGKVFIGGMVDRQGVMRCLDEAVGSRPSDACNGSPLVDGDLLYVTTANGVDRLIEVPIEQDAARRCFAPNAPTLIVLDKRTGRFLARDTAPTAANMLHGQWSSPSLGAVQGRELVCLGGGDGICYAFEALAGVPEDPVTLKTVWWVDCNPPEYRSFVGMSEIIATPVFYKNRV